MQQQKAESSWKQLPNTMVLKISFNTIPIIHDRSYLTILLIEEWLRSTEKCFFSHSYATFTMDSIACLDHWLPIWFYLNTINILSIVLNHNLIVAYNNESVVIFNNRRNIINLKSISYSSLGITAHLIANLLKIAISRTLMVIDVSFKRNRLIKRNYHDIIICTRSFDQKCFSTVAVC